MIKLETSLGLVVTKKDSSFQHTNMRNRLQKTKNRAIVQILLSAICVATVNLVVLSHLEAQPVVALSPWQPPVTIGNRQLLHPFAGGLNNPQLSSVDLNNDGLEDLYIFDRAGNVQLHFLNEGNPGQPAYVYRPEAGLLFPHLTDWVLLRDYNGDGVQDIFAYGDAPFSGMMVFTGYYTPDNQLAFARYNFNNPLNLVYFPLPNGSQTQLYITSIDYPAIDDLDCDGDLDIATFNINGGYAELYKNMSVEMGYGLDSLIYRLTDDCWGGFYESGISNNQVDLASSANDCSGNFDDGEEVVDSRHAGSTLLTFDADNDGDKDLVLGDLSYFNLNFLTNAGSCADAWFNQQDPVFPAYNTPAELVYFPVSFYLDYNDDGRKDLLAAPNQRGGSQDYDCLWYYTNVGTDAQPIFQLTSRRLLVDEMIDLGTGAYPFPVDYNADGLLDIVVGNNSYFNLTGEKESRLHLFKNVGTPTEPAFQLVDEDYLGFSQYSTSSFYFVPAFGDLDNDGDLDLLVGEQNGRLFYAQNLAGAGQPFAFGPITYNYMNIAIGQASVPRLIDLNRDGLIDLLIGERSGNINYFQNIGSPTQAAFNSDFTVLPNRQFLGGIDTRIPGSTLGFSTPWLLDYGSDIQIITGTNVGRLEWYGNVLGNLDGAFSTLTETLAGLNPGSQSCPVMADWNNDGMLDLLVGNQRGGLQFFRTNISTGGIVATNDAAPTTDIVVFPNPAKQYININWPDQFDYEVRLYDINGRSVGRWHSAGNQTLSILLNGQASGNYLLQVLSGSKTTTRLLTIVN